MHDRVRNDLERPLWIHDRRALRSRNSLARDVFHGRRGQLRQHYQAGQENQLGALGLMVNVIVLWQTVYIQAALYHLATNEHDIDPADVA